MEAQVGGMGRTAEAVCTGLGLEPALVVVGLETTAGEEEVEEDEGLEDEEPEPEPVMASVDDVSVNEVEGDLLDVIEMELGPVLVLGGACDVVRTLGCVDCWF